MEKLGKKEIIISCTFLVLGIFWIYVTDTLLVYYTPYLTTAQFGYIQLAKGILFIVIVATYIFVLLRSYASRLKASLKLVRATAEELESVMEGFSDGFFILNNDMSIARANDRFKEIVSDRNGLIEGKKLFEIFPHLANSAFYRFYHEAWESKETRYFDQQSSVTQKWYRVNIYPFSHGMSVFFRDVTEEKENAIRIQENEKNLVTLINSTEFPIWSVDKNYRYFIYNKAYEEAYKLIFNEELHVGKTALILDHGKQHYDLWKGLYGKALQGEAFTIDMDFELNNQLHRTVISFNPIYIDQSIIGVGCFLQDVTERCEHEQQIKEQNDRLREIAFITSHSLRAPLANILGLASILDKENPSNPFNADVIDKIVVSSKLLDSKIKELVQQAGGESKTD